MIVLPISKPNKQESKERNYLMGKFEGKVVAITGTSAGVGRSAAKLYAEQGAKVIGIARRAELQESLKKEIGATGGIFIPVVGDVTVEADVDRFIETAVNAYGRLDILVNNAGTSDRLYMGHNTSNEIWDEIIALNLTAPFKVCRKGLACMLNQPEGGNIVNIGSVASIRGMIGGAAYTASKHGLLGLTKSIAYNYAKKGIRCNLVMPGGVDTYLCSPEIFAINEQEGFAMSNTICAGMIRMAQPEEIANVILYLSSDDASILNGAAVAADAGFTAS